MLTQLSIFIVGLIGAAALAYGASLYSPPLGWVVGGMLCLVWSFLMSRAVAAAEYAKRNKGDS
ncbi:MULTISPECIES: hypothetical protein [Aeromonas]|uniref:hypothetical protein n=1 Tax=Aeromonas TaxID=642 RepID=UPI00259EDA06|nr:MULTISPECIES: hypothetical protein [Aeromonas]MDM5112831.1 hypothetical protein [Aeromonas salmonicida]MDX7877681.1 hypothetical protein [Aeromonas veronii]